VGTMVYRHSLMSQFRAVSQPPEWQSSSKGASATSSNMSGMRGVEMDAFQLARPSPRRALGEGSGDAPSKGEGSPILAGRAAAGCAFPPKGAGATRRLMMQRGGGRGGGAGRVSPWRAVRRRSHAHGEGQGAGAHPERQGAGACAEGAVAGAH
jgi:hypothetical protein